MLKLVHSNDLTVNYFDDYKKAVEFLCESLMDKIDYTRLLTRDQAVKHMNNLCDKYIECTEMDNGKNRYRVRIKK